MGHQQSPQAWSLGERKYRQRLILNHIAIADLVSSRLLWEMVQPGFSKVSQVPVDPAAWVRDNQADFNDGAGRWKPVVSRSTAKPLAPSGNNIGSGPCQKSNYDCDQQRRNILCQNNGANAAVVRRRRPFRGRLISIQRLISVGESRIVCGVASRSCSPPDQ